MPPPYSILDHFNTVLVHFFGFLRTTLSTGKQKLIWAEVPALQGFLFTYLYVYNTNIQIATIRRFGLLLGSDASLEGSLTRVGQNCAISGKDGLAFLTNGLSWAGLGFFQDKRAGLGLAGAQ